MSYRIVLNDVPVISKKNRMRFTRNRVFKPKNVVAFEQALHQAAKDCGPPEPLLGDVTMTVDVTVPNRIRRDLQNFTDTIADALNGIIYCDDSQIVDLHIRKFFSSEKRWGLDICVDVKQP
jgi:Holliday junction resolvase RusA-like endonuclease